MRDDDVKTKHLAQAGYLGPKAQAEARSPVRANGRRDVAAGTVQTHGTTTGRFPPGDVGFGRATHTVYPVKYVVTVGGLSGGFQFYGPFSEDKHAARWVYNNLKRGTDCSIHKMSDVRDGE